MSTGEGWRWEETDKTEKVCVAVLQTVLAEAPSESRVCCFITEKELSEKRLDSYEVPGWSTVLLGA